MTYLTLKILFLLIQTSNIISYDLSTFMYSLYYIQSTLQCALFNFFLSTISVIYFLYRFDITTTLHLKNLLEMSITFTTIVKNRPNLDILQCPIYAISIKRQSRIKLEMSI